MDVFTFSNAEDMWEAMRRATDEANAGLAMPQRMVTYGDHWVRFYDIGARIVVFGKVMTEAEFVTGETELGADPDEIAEELEQLQKRHDDGYLFGKAHSIMEPEGEYGDTHKANVWPIEERLFVAAQTVDWNIDQLSPDGKLLLEIAYACYRTHLRVKGANS